MQTQELKHIPLERLHQTMGAKMVEFGGYLMPVRYTSEKQEHLNVRENVGVFDVSHMGEFLVSGAQALDFIQWVSANDASKLSIGKAQYSYLPNAHGGIVDDLLIYRLDEQEYMLVVNASNIEKDWNWLQTQLERFPQVQMRNISEQVALFAVQGPRAAEAIQRLTDTDLKSIPYYHFEIGTFAGVGEVLISATGYTGAGGFELYVPVEHAEDVWNAIFEAGKAFNIQPAGLGARDTLRLEMGYCLYGNDIDDHTSPLEAGLGWVTKFSKRFVADEILLKQKEEGIKRLLTGFKMIDKGVPRQGFEIKNQSGEVVGKVTSGTLSPSLNVGIGLSYLPVELAVEGTHLYIDVRGRQLAIEVVKPPFIKKQN
ncbi:aminomethyltransferase [Thermonema lapsum]|uniref:Aminomethyltransferase n=1 Tax=Thermonema lapsum TaxID=28195 RepID=A0A846MU98_9BACT|nr:glycine cleavage system aminomethyltransferase GcvT [Thermonema lapsum]NIK74807.1 aminomethyltransferase [Thermonema lapsum]